MNKNFKNNVIKFKISYFLFFSVFLTLVTDWIYAIEPTELIVFDFLLLFFKLKSFNSIFNYALFPFQPSNAHNSAKNIPRQLQFFFAK